MSKQQKSGRVSLWKRMRDGYDRAMGRQCRVELTGCTSLTLQGCDRILEYGQSCIRLAVRDPDMCEVVVCGEELLCLSYHPDAVLVRGSIHCIRFLSDGMAMPAEESEEI